MFILGILSDKTWEEIENKVLKFEKNSKTPSSSGENVLPLLGHSQSDLFIHKQSVSDKMVADSIESLIGVYVFVSVNYLVKLLKLFLFF